MQTNHLNFAAAEVSFVPTDGILEVMVRDTAEPNKWVRVLFTVNELRKWATLCAGKSRTESFEIEANALPDLGPIPDAPPGM